MWELEDYQIEWLNNYKKPIKEKKKDNWKIVHLKWNYYFRAYEKYYRNKYFFRDYFLKWNKWLINWKDLVEQKIFNYWDLYYIKKTKW